MGTTCTIPIAVDALEDTVAQELLAAEAKRLGYFEDPEIMRMVKKMAVQKLVKEQIDGEIERIVNTPEELRAYYDTHPEEFSKPSVAKAQILWLTDDADVDAVMTQATAGQPAFGELVKTHSRDVAAKVNGGMSGWIIEGGENKRYLPAVVEKVFTLKQPGEISGPLKTERGTFIIKLVEIRRGAVTSFEDAQRNISRMIYRSKRQEAYNAYCEQLKARFPVEINDKAFEAMIVSPNPNAGPPLGPVRIKPAN